MPSKMAKVNKCTVSDCSYYKNEQCITPAITVGDTTDPLCDTYIHSDRRGGKDGVVAGVGACKVTDCQYNEDLECAANGIQVGYKDNQPDCLTYQA